MLAIPESEASPELANSPHFPEKKKGAVIGPNPDNNRFDATGTAYGTCLTEPGPSDDNLYCAQTLSPSWIAWKWYKFIDQPALQRLGLDANKKTWMQSRVVQLHRMIGRKSQWLNAGSAETAGLGRIDTATEVSPPDGLEYGYVPIVLYEGLDKPAGCSSEVAQSRTPDESPVEPSDASRDAQCGYSIDKNIGWTGKEEAIGKLANWILCCCACSDKATGENPCAGWVFNSENYCWLKMYNGTTVTLTNNVGAAVPTVAGLLDPSPEKQEANDATSEANGATSVNAPASFLMARAAIVWSICTSWALFLD